MASVRDTEGRWPGPPWQFDASAASQGIQRQHQQGLLSPAVHVARPSSRLSGCVDDLVRERALLGYSALCPRTPQCAARDAPLVRPFAARGGSTHRSGRPRHGARRPGKVLGYRSVARAWWAPGTRDAAPRHHRRTRGRPPAVPFVGNATSEHADGDFQVFHSTSGTRPWAGCTC